MTMRRGTTRFWKPPRQRRRAQPEQRHLVVVEVPPGLYYRPGARFTETEVRAALAVEPSAFVGVVFLDERTGRLLVARPWGLQAA